MNFDEYKEKYPEQKKRIKALEKRSKEAESFLAIRDTLAVKRILQELEASVCAINERLIKPERLEAEAREVLLADKERCLWFIDAFDESKLSLKRIDEALKKLDKQYD